MVFASLPFIFFIFPLFLVIDFLSQKKNIIRNCSLIGVSLFFYSFDGDNSSFTVLICYGLLNYLFGYILEVSKSKSEVCRRLLLIIFVVINILALVFYKYAYWIVSLFQESGIVENINFKHRALPLGISFFTFHAVSYLIDISRGELNGKSKFINFLTYFFMFPHLIAGPIVRFKQVTDDLDNRTYDSNLFNYGLYRFILGVNKKILIANSVAPMADLAFAYNITDISMLDAWVGAIAYMLQIYFDFSAYSDMAIGLAAIAGFRFSENFMSPYKSRSIKEFWRRWHISLSSWLRDYVYIPLGGSRVRTSRIYFNLITVFFLCGLWHGANFTFVVWGLYNGLFLILERLFLGKVLERIPSILTHLYAVFVVLIGWVIFRSDNLTQAVDYLSVMFGFNNFGNVSICSYKVLNYIAFVAGIIISFISIKKFDSSNSKEASISTLTYSFNSVLFILSILVMYFGAQNPFIYFNF